ncbi:hypothetical protein [Ruania alba]|uniref:Uncharacterized protein n=1 Tax=Ruania alba TaxID=648782 RepID=A0A1H5NGT0_9MICO|nr:hypothetical protein [Ruania alba]SEF00813.1 hypothetical protein SAMN04488554_4328 [Ruania alba]
MHLTLRSLPAAVAAAALTTASLAGAFGAPSAGAESVTSAPVGAACADDTGVTVVVDATELGGDIEIGCAEGDPATGREALESAGFDTSNSEAGYLCAIGGQPDPCVAPEDFDGVFWSYWNAEPEGEWTSYEVGADEADPAPGAIEGWRYSDGAEGPGIAPVDVLAVAEPEETTDESAEDADEPAEESSTPVLPILAVVLGLALVAAIVLVVRRRARS